MAGMTEKQKDSLRNHLDSFRKQNGGCILCQKKIDEFYYTPNTQSHAEGVVATGNSLELHVYGSCEDHTMLSNIDFLMEKKVNKLKEEYKDTQLPILMTVTFSQDSEQVRFA